MKFVKFVGVKCLAAWAVGIYQKKDRNDTFLSSKIQAMNYLSINQSFDDLAFDDIFHLRHESIFLNCF